ncbi:MAG: lysophospholipase [candidate division KSB1 bacterium]|nr:lysophospholipase [candidate division KSB1 bacterium]
MSKKLLAVVILFLLFGSCTTIKLTEKEAFDVKRTISPEYFKGSRFELEEIKIPTADSLSLSGWFIQNPKAKGMVLYFGGNGFVMVTSFHIIRAIIDQNVNLLVFDYRGYGQNDGIPSVTGLKMDGLAAYDFLAREKKIMPENLIIHGHSLGSFIAAFVANERPAAGLVLECPVTDAKDWTSRLVPWFLKPLVRFEIEPALLENSNVKRLATIETPLLILAGGNDQITPSGMAEKLFQIAKSSDKQLKIIADGGHNNLPQKEEYKAALAGFYEKIFGKEKWGRGVME